MSYSVALIQVRTHDTHTIVGPVGWNLGGGKQEEEARQWKKRRNVASLKSAHKILGNLIEFCLKPLSHTVIVLDPVHSCATIQLIRIEQFQSGRVVF